MLCTALPLTPRALPQCTTTVYHGALVNHSIALYALTHSTTTGLVSAALPAWLAGWPGTPEFAERAWGQNPDFAEWGCGSKIQISRNGLGAPKIQKLQGSGRGSVTDAKSTLFNFPNFYDTVFWSPVISVSQKNAVFRKEAHRGEASD